MQRCSSFRGFSFNFRLFFNIFFNNFSNRHGSTRIYKTLQRSHQKSTESQVKSSITGHQLRRSSSTPSLKRCWICQSCKCINASVTWHCLNCECVSFIAPIYKGTLQKPADSMSVSADKTAAATIIGYDQIKGTTTQSQSTKRKSTDGSASIGKGAAGVGNSSNRFDDNYAFSVSPTTDYYIQQLKYNEVTRYQPNNALYLWQRRRANKSTPNIVQAFAHCNPRSQEFSDQLFGERIFSVNKSNAFATTNRTANGTTLVRNAVTPTHEIHQFTRFATKSAVRETIAKKMCRHGAACGGCHMCRVNDDGCSINAGDSSRFTITTLSRKHSVPGDVGDKRMQTRNSGVLIAVRDWSKTAIVEPSNQNAEADDYYERLRTSDTVDGRGENGGPLYAVVNKMNKTKNRQIPSTADQTKFTYIGISPTGNSKAAKSEAESIARQAQQNNMHSSDATALANAINMNSVNNNGILVNECVTAVNPDFSTKIWKGAKKTPNDSQKR